MNPTLQHHPLHPLLLPPTLPTTSAHPATLTTADCTCALSTCALGRLQLEEGYRQYNEQAVASGRSKGFFMVDICRPGHMTACLTTFQASKTIAHAWTASVKGKGAVSRLGYSRQESSAAVFRGSVKHTVCSSPGETVFARLMTVWWLAVIGHGRS